jgi:hypothetical protein
MLKKIISNFKYLDKLALKIMKYGFGFCLIICMLSVLILFMYDFIFAMPFIYYIGINLFKLSLIFGIEFIICGFIVDGIKNQLI